MSSSSGIRFLHLAGVELTTQIVFPLLRDVVDSAPNYVLLYEPGFLEEDEPVIDMLPGESEQVAFGDSSRRMGTFDIKKLKNPIVGNRPPGGRKAEWHTSTVVSGIVIPNPESATIIPSRPLEVVSCFLPSLESTISYWRITIPSETTRGPNRSADSDAAIRAIGARRSCVPVVQAPARDGLAERGSETMCESAHDAQKHSDDESTDGDTAVEAVDRVKDGHSHFLGLAAAAADEDAEAVSEHADELRDVLDDVEGLFQGDF